MKKIVAAAFLLLVPSLLADDARDKFLARRAKRTVERVAMAPEPLATVTGVLSIVASKSWTDSSGNFALVGEVRNTGTLALTYPRLDFTLSGGGAIVGTDYEYVDGNMSARVAGATYVSDILAPNAVGLFKLYTSLKNVTSYTYTSQGSAVSSYVAGLAKPTMHSPFNLDFDEIGGVVKNLGTTTAYLITVHMAGYLNGSINDYDYAFVDGVTVRCGTSSQNYAVAPGSTGEMWGASFGRQVDSIGRHAILFFECSAASTDPTLDLALNKYTYATGDSITTTDFRLRNPGSKSRAVEVKLFLSMPGLEEPVSLISIGADGSLSLPAGLNQSLGAITLMTITAGTTRGDYEFSSRIVNPASGKQISENLNPFVVK